MGDSRRSAKTEVLWLVRAMGSVLQPAKRGYADKQGCLDNGDAQLPDASMQRHVDAWDAEQEARNDAECERSLAAIFGAADAVTAAADVRNLPSDSMLPADLDQEALRVSCVDAHLNCSKAMTGSGRLPFLQGAQREALFKVMGLRLFLPRPVFSFATRQLPLHHFPRPEVDQMVLHLRIVGRVLWALHSVLRGGFTENMLDVLTATYPATILSDLRHFSIAALADVAAAMPTQCARPAIEAMDRDNIDKFIAR
jgi:hypothetical protein